MLHSGRDLYRKRDPGEEKYNRGNMVSSGANGDISSGNGRKPRKIINKRRNRHLCILSGETGGENTEAFICLGISVSVEPGCDSIVCSHGMLFSKAYGKDDVDIISLGM